MSETQDNKVLFRTEDLSLAALLHLEGVSPAYLERQGTGCVFVFDLTMETMAGRSQTAELIEDYRDGVVEVEPKEFTKSLAITRKNMYKFLEVGPRTVRGSQD